MSFWDTVKKYGGYAIGGPGVGATIDLTGGAVDASQGNAPSGPLSSGVTKLGAAGYDALSGTNTRKSLYPDKAAGQSDAEAQKLADMKMIAQAYQERRPEVEQARLNALRMQSMSLQPLQNAMATMYGGRPGGNTSALPNGMGPPPPPPMGGLVPQGGQAPASGPGRMGSVPMAMPPNGQLPPNGIRMPAPMFGGPPSGAPPRPQMPMPPPPGTGVSGVTVDPSGMFRSPLTSTAPPQGAQGGIRQMVPPIPPGMNPYARG